MTDELLKAVARKLAAASGYDPDETWEEFDRNAAATVTNCGDYEGWQDDVFPKFIRWHEFVPQAETALSLMQPEIDRRVAEERAKLLERLREPSEAMIEAGVDRVQHFDLEPHLAEAIWQAMLAAFEKGQADG